MPAEVVDPVTVKPPFPAGLAPGSRAPLSEQVSEAVGTLAVAAPVESKAEKPRDAAAVVVVVVAASADSEVGETVGLPNASVVVSSDVVSTPLTSVTIMMVPSVTVVSGTPASGVGVGDGF